MWNTFCSSIQYRKGYNIKLKMSHFIAFRKKSFEDENDLPNLTTSLDFFNGRFSEKNENEKTPSEKKKKKEGVVGSKKLKSIFQLLGLKKKPLKPKTLKISSEILIN